jgi:hypothetical protein
MDTWSSVSTSFNLLRASTLWAFWLILSGAPANHLSPPRSSTEPSNSYRWDYGRRCSSNRDTVQSPLTIESAPGRHHPPSLSSSLHCPSHPRRQQRKLAPSGYLISLRLSDNKRRFRARVIYGTHVFGVLPPLAMFSYPDRYLYWRLNQHPRPLLSSSASSIQTWSHQTVRRLQRALRLRSHYCPTSSLRVPQ